MGIINDAMRKKMPIDAKARKVLGRKTGKKLME